MKSAREHALVLGGGTWQVPILSYLRRHDFEVTVVDPNANCPGSKIADHHLCLDARDYKTLLREFSAGHFKLVISDQSDLLIEGVAHLAQAWGLHGNTPEVVERFTDKAKCRQLARTLGIPQPEFGVAEDLAGVLNFIKRRPGPCMIKPADSQSSRGVTRVESAADAGLMQAVEGALLNSTRKKIIVEDFVNGSEVTVEGLCSGGRHRCLAASMKKHFRTALASELCYPSGLPLHLERQIFAALDRLVEGAGLNFGITHAEILVDIAREKFWLVEIACRGGGTLISSDIAPWVSGVDFYGVLLADLKGQSTDLAALPCQTRGAMLGFFEFPSGVVKRVHGVDEVRAWPGVHRLELEFQVGDRLRAANDDRSRQGFAVLLSETGDQVEALWKKVRAAIQVEVR